MRTVEIRKRLIEEINLSSNKNLLEEMYNFLNHDNDANLFKLTKVQKEAIAEAREQIKNGQYMTNDQVNNEIEEWLKEK
ncbi:hypothetical protein KIH23_10200 [Flavobacterium sp. CYK-55]|uniref:hypothetical protein n=1 Tax=Flavobacterium sp. CYK-55 TaxID=2835529 RepID=UPI001BD18812|nr:hypothetical protein [Flavobacterium sp. CYK-55]MBS7787669.1 hypothetical protein [Flavobacterium sp. CYK-55]